MTGDQFTVAQKQRVAALEQARSILERRGGPFTGATAPPVDDLIQLATWILASHPIQVPPPFSGEASEWHEGWLPPADTDEIPGLFDTTDEVPITEPSPMKKLMDHFVTDPADENPAFAPIGDSDRDWPWKGKEDDA